MAATQLLPHATELASRRRVVIATDHVEVELDQATGQIIEIEGYTPPYDYEVIPGMGLMRYSEIRNKLLAEFPGAEIIAWELSQEADGT